jgi:hypothetical protein
MIITGDSAKGWCAVRLDTFEQVNQGPLLEANDESGSIRWIDKQGREHGLVLGSNAIRILPRSRYGR